MALDQTARSQPEKDARKWKKELSLAKKREKDWIAEAEKIVKRYRGEEKKKNRFNVLWSNTEILLPAIYNSRPNPDVRRRFRDADPVGKAVSEVLERSLSVFVDGDETDSALRNDVLDGLLPGRGVSRVRYVPTIGQVEKAKSAAANDDDDDETTAPTTGDASDEPAEEPEEEVASEYCCLEHVDWRDYREGYGRVWAEVPWTAYRHKLTRSDALEKFNDTDIANVKFATPDADDPNKPGDQVGETQKVAEFWEFWDKTGKRVFFTQDDVDHLIYPKDNADGTPPLELDGFFPSPQPLQLIADTGSRLPIPIFRLYEEQANELDRISGRINKIVDAMRLRAVYDASIPEMADLVATDDNEMIPIQNAKQWADGGLDKAISWMPVEKAVEILNALYDARGRQKAIIDEILGIADIMRGATDPDETLGAQQLKANYGSGRLGRMQKEVQRYARDILRLAASVMGQKFSPHTFTMMTELNFPTAQEKALAQQQAAQPPMAAPGAPPPPPAPPNPILSMPTWEDVIGVMRSEKRCQYTIDIETDSTIAGTLSSDMAGLSQVLKAISETLQGMAPLVMNGSLPVDAAKEVVMAVIRRARMGLAVEDAFDKMQAPKPPPDPNAGKAQAAMQQTQAKAQAEIQVAQIKAQLDAHVAQMTQQAQAQQNAQEQQLEAARAAQDHQFDIMQMKFDAFVKIIVATITATKQADAQVQPVADRTVSGALTQ